MKWFILIVVFCFSCVSKKNLKKTDDFLTEALNSPTKFEKTEFQSRYWVFDNYLVHFISNINDQNKNLTPIIYIHGLAGSLEDFSEMIKALHTAKSSRPFYALDLPGFGKSFSQNSELSIQKYSDL